jgi:nucleoside phosphorylase
MDADTEAPPSLAECRAAARAIRRAECARDVLGLLRPRGVSPLLRATPPLTLQIYAGKLGGRLIWCHPGAVALIDEPLATRPPIPAARRVRVQRVLHRHWDVFAFGAPPAVGLLVSALFALALLAGAPLGWPLVIAALAPCTAALVWVVVHLTLSVLAAGLSIVRMLENRQASPEVRTLDLYRQENWSLPLLHVDDEAEVSEVLEAARERAWALTHASGCRRPGSEQRSHGSRRAESDEDSYPLLCIERGITTRGAREAARIASGVTRHDDALPGILLLHRPGRSAPPKPPVNAFDGASFVLGGAALCLSIIAFFLAAAEKSSCALDACAGRPVNYLDALTWLAYRLIWQNPDGIAPATMFGRYLGFFVPLLGVILGAVIAMALVQYTRTGREQVKAHMETVGAMSKKKTTVLILVAATVERDAVTQHIVARNGGEGTKIIDGGVQSVMDLGVVSSCNVLLAQSEQGTVDPGAMMLVAAELVTRLRPDYLILTGICFGLRPKEQRLTDVLVATQVECMDWQKTVEDEDGNIRIITRGDRVAASSILRDRARLTRDGWKQSTVHFGLVLSLNTLVNSRRRTEELRRFKADAIGGEMEAAGVYAVGAREMTDWIVIKAISDWGSGKTDRNQKPAANAAAGFVAQMIGSGYLDKPPGELRRVAVSS